MSEYSKRNYLVPAALVFIGLPLFFWFQGDFPRRSDLKETFSILSILAFCLMLGQFFLARSNKHVRKSLRMKTALGFHKTIGYIFVLVLLVHPFFIVIPKYFKAGIAPMEAFVTIITTFESMGVILGLSAWLLMLILVITALFRNVLPMTYKTWRIFHGVLAIFFIGLATWHAVDLGRHTDLAMSTYMIILAASGVLLLLKTYFFKSSEKTGGE